MKAVNSIGIFGAVSSSTVSALAAVERGAVAIHNTANLAVSITAWGNEEIDNLRGNRAIKREVESEIYRTKYVMEAAKEVAEVHAEAMSSMSKADPEVKAVFDALVAKHLAK
jgi:hypothetical protein